MAGNFMMNTLKEGMIWGSPHLQKPENIKSFIGSPINKLFGNKNGKIEQQESYNPYAPWCWNMHTYIYPRNGPVM
jgi:hypothetical protein